VKRTHQIQSVYVRLKPIMKLKAHPLITEQLWQLKSPTAGWRYSSMLAHAYLDTSLQSLEKGLDDATAEDGFGSV
jgi:hypothetical protein